MKRSAMTLGMGLLVLVLIAGKAQAQLDLHRDVAGLTAVEKEFSLIKSEWYKLILPDEINDYGFMSVEEAQQAEAGPFIELYSMHVDREGKTQYSRTHEYLVPMMVNGQARVFVKMAFFEKKYQMVSVGETTLAMDASEIIQQAASASGRLIWIQHLNFSADFIATVSDEMPGKDLTLIPIFTARRAGIDSAMPVSRVIELLSSTPYSID